MPLIHIISKITKTRQKYRARQKQYSAVLYNTAQQRAGSGQKQSQKVSCTHC